MTKSNSRTPRTPIIQEVIDRWNDFATKNNIRLAPPEFISDIGFKAKVNVEYGGACICKRKERPVCPCPECLGEVVKDGW
jgi:hypothetical protein